MIFRLNSNDTRSLRRVLIIISLFSISMGFLESAVVVYMRDILYPGGFDFPLAPIDSHLALTEILREAATIIMLFTVGILAGRNTSERFAWFLYSFAVWDIFYYVFLKLLIGWPASLLSWDILFLIPVTWVGPVIAPVIVALTMILFALIILHYSYSSRTSYISNLQWILLVSGSIVLIISFTWDYSGFILENHSFSEIWTLPKGSLYELATSYVPRKFNWWMFCLGEGIILAGIILFYRQIQRSEQV